jgi:hypothetical protein
MNPLRLAHETLPLTPTINDISRFTLDLGGGGNYRLKIKKNSNGVRGRISSKFVQHSG